MEILKDLKKIDELYIECIKEVADKSEVNIKEILLALSKELKSFFYKLTYEAETAIEIIQKKFSHLFKEATFTKEKIIKKAEETKKLGFRVFEIAKAALDGAIKEAKKAMKQDK